MAIPKCNFCLKDKNQVKVLIRGPEAFICDECVSSCTQTLLIDEIRERETEIRKAFFCEYWGTDH